MQVGISVITPATGGAFRRARASLHSAPAPDRMSSNGHAGRHSLAHELPSLCGERGFRAKWRPECETLGRAGDGGCSHLPGEQSAWRYRDTIMSAGRATAAGTRERPHLDLNPMFRAGILAVTSNPMVSRAVRRYGMRLGASRFVAGETFAEAIPVLRSLNQSGLRTNTTLLGEGVKDSVDDASRRRRVQGGPRPHRRGGAADQYRAQVDTPWSRSRSRARL